MEPEHGPMEDHVPLHPSGFGVPCGPLQLRPAFPETNPQLNDSRLERTSELKSQGKQLYIHIHTQKSPLTKRRKTPINPHVTDLLLFGDDHTPVTPRHDRSRASPRRAPPARQTTQRRHHRVHLGVHREGPVPIRGWGWYTPDTTHLSGPIHHLFLKMRLDGVPGSVTPDQSKSPSSMAGYVEGE